MWYYNPFLPVHWNSTPPAEQIQIPKDLNVYIHLLTTTVECDKRRKSSAEHEHKHNRNRFFFGLWEKSTCVELFSVKSLVSLTILHAKSLINITPLHPALNNHVMVHFQKAFLSVLYVASLSLPNPTCLSQHVHIASPSHQLRCDKPTFHQHSQ